MVQAPAPITRVIAALKHYGLQPADPESWIYLVDGNAYPSLDAMIRAGRRVGNWACWGAVLGILPRPVQDWLYRRLARNRYRLFGRTDMCAVSDAGLKQRLLSERSSSLGLRRIWLPVKRPRVSGRKRLEHAHPAALVRRDPRASRSTVTSRPLDGRAVNAKLVAIRAAIGPILPLLTQFLAYHPPAASI